MKILAVEFSSPKRSVAVVETRSVGATPVASLSLRERARGRGMSGRQDVVLLGATREAGALATRALSLVEAALRDAGCEREQIECIAVGLGPGSYTGIRAAISLAQAWQLARGVKLLGVSSAQALALAAQRAGFFGLVNVVIDAQRDEFCLARWQLDATERREVEALHITPKEEVQARLKAGEVCVGPEVHRWFPAARELFPDAAAVAELAAGREDFKPGSELAPIYLRETSFVKAPSARRTSGSG
jgi:tRNA threonylcarbamoyl adenosine modification protein YeaZ